MRAARRGRYTLWELTMVLLVLAIAATLAVPAFTRLRARSSHRAAPTRCSACCKRRAQGGDRFQRERHAAPRSRDAQYEADTSSVSGYGVLAAGTLDLGLSRTLVTDLPRLQYVFRPTGAAFGDTVVVRGGPMPLDVRIDPWSGVARADSL